MFKAIIKAIKPYRVTCHLAGRKAPVVYKCWSRFEADYWLQGNPKEVFEQQFSTITRLGQRVAVRYYR